MSQSNKGRIAVVIESHFDETEYRRFNEFFPEHGYEVDYVTYLWGQPELEFVGNDFTQRVTVTKDLADVDLADYRAVILIGGYAMDRLRYQEHPVEGQPNTAPAVEFLRDAARRMDAGELKMGTICHSMWLFCAAPEVLSGRHVTCAHNIMGDVESAGGKLVYDGDQLADTNVDGGLVTGRHPGVVDQFMDVFLRELEG